MVIMHSHQTRNRSKLIEERIELAKQKAEDIYVNTYLTILRVLYEYTLKKTPQVLSQLEKIVERTDIFSPFDSSVLAAIRDYIMDHIPPTEQYYRRERLKLPPKNIGKRIWDVIYNKAKIYRITPAYKQKIQNLRKGLEYLMMANKDISETITIYELTRYELGGYITEILEAKKDIGETIKELDRAFKYAYNYIVETIEDLFYNREERFLKKIEDGIQLDPYKKVRY